MRTRDGAASPRVLSRRLPKQSRRGRDQQSLYCSLNRLDLDFPDCFETGRKIFPFPHGPKAGKLGFRRVLPPESAAPGWDIADAAKEGWTFDRLLSHIDERAVAIAGGLQPHQPNGGCPQAGRSSISDLAEFSPAAQPVNSPARRTARDKSGPSRCGPRRWPSRPLCHTAATLQPHPCRQG